MHTCHGNVPFASHTSNFKLFCILKLKATDTYLPLHSEIIYFILYLQNKNTDLIFKLSNSNYLSGHAPNKFFATWLGFSFSAVAPEKIDNYKEGVCVINN